MITRIADDQTTEPGVRQPVKIPMGTAFGIDGTPLFVVPIEQNVAPEDESAALPVLSCQIESTIPIDSEVQIITDGLDWTKLVETESFQLASPDVRQFTVWALGNDIGLADLQPFLKSETPRPRLKLRSL